MRQLIDKFLIILFGLVMFYDSSGTAVPVISFLAAISASALIQYFGRGRVSLLAELIYILLCVVNPYFIFFLPVVLYDVLMEKRYYFCILSALVFIYGITFHSLGNILLLIICTLMTVILQIKTSAFGKLEKKYIESRDTSAEANMRLTRKNEMILENQDNEISLATLKERNRIAREIHDNVGHLLSRSILQLGAMQITCKDENQKVCLDGLSDTLNKAMTEIRQSVHNLHDDSVDMKQTISDSVKPLSDKGIDLSLKYEITRNIPNDIKFCFISVVKEAVSNILRHSNADFVHIALTEHPAFYQLLIEDNGRCDGTIHKSGIGLSNMRERVENLGGIITVTPDKLGFRIFISIKKVGVK